MSLYNMLFGKNENSDKLLKVLGIEPSAIPRFRDCFIDGDNIIIHTRTGGGNREYYENLETRKKYNPEDFTGAEDDPVTGPWNDDLRANQYYIKDSDDGFDSTYANFYFRFPDEHRDVLRCMATDIKTMTAAEKWNKILGG